MNIEKIDKLIDRLRSLPDGPPRDRPIMDRFYSFDETCGTVGCIAGEAVLMEGMYNKGRLGPDDVAAGILEITSLQALHLFYLCEWPTDIRREYRDALNTSLAAERAVMIKRLEWLKERGE